MGTNSTESLTIFARHRGGNPLFTIREQKYLLHHRSHCRYHRRPKSAQRVLASMLDILFGLCRMGRAQDFAEQEACG